MYSKKYVVKKVAACLMGIGISFMCAGCENSEETKDVESVDPVISSSEYETSGEDGISEDEEQTGYKVNNPELSRIVDEADVLTDSEEQSLSDKISNLISKYGYDLVIVTTNSTGSKISEESANEYYYQGYGVGSDNDGALMLVNAETGEWYITANDNLKNKFTGDDLDNAVSEIDDASYPYFVKKEYGKAFDAILNKVDIVLGGLSADSLTSEKLNESDKTDKSYEIDEDEHIEDTEDIERTAWTEILKYFEAYDYEGAYNYLNEMVSKHPDVTELQNILDNLETSYEGHLLDNLHFGKENAIQAYAWSCWTGNGDVFLNLLPGGFEARMEDNMHLTWNQISEKIFEDSEYKGNTVCKDVKIVEEDEQNMSRFNETLAYYGASYAEEAYYVECEVTIGQELADKMNDGDTHIGSNDYNQFYICRIGDLWYAFPEWVNKYMETRNDG